MIIVHHLLHSRSTRILWLLEEMGVPYDMVTYPRDPKTMRAGPELRRIHPLGKAPVIEDDGRVIGESGAILEYLIETYGDGRFAPAPGSADRAAYLEWMHFAESSAMLGVIFRMIAGRGALPPAATAYADESIALAMAAIEQALQTRDFLVGGDLTGADIQVQYVTETAAALGLIGDRPAIRAWHDRLTARPAYLRALEKGGPVMLPVLRPPNQEG
jgi:glutathione S-transferase